jgi:hypothetical protein
MKNRTDLDLSLISSDIPMVPEHIVEAWPRIRKPARLLI